MLIVGYEEDQLVAGEALLDTPGFWASYLIWLCDSDGDEDDDHPSPEWFGATDEEADAAYEALSDESRWPVFRIPFHGGHTAVVLERNFPEDGGTEYAIVHPEWGRPGFLATIDGHQAGPGLSWRELVYIAENPDAAAAGIQDPQQRLLMLIPALGDVELPDEAAAVVGRALVSVGCPAESASRIALRLLDSPMWKPARWTRPDRPAADGEPVFAGILECDGQLSPRRGVQLAQGITREQCDRLARALGTWPV
ncbi:hypothetical protein KDL01_09155 [Actinospica durhamensis]|uniref:Uncharacterized protein n=1 Tax=Actinospica durhamensis TaxID=1508375 RepID=A0A941EKT2_9ACTN|nr:hypothetical protein [Actinospica durhamensis]MBR7833432.1 hypothetical protein [Actinospica durhamensis]